jgi:acetyl esterase/lipase
METTYCYKVGGGSEILADVHLPDGVPHPPVIVWLHGGALIGGSRNGIQRRHLRRYLAAGYAVVAPDYRLAPETKLPEIVEDVRDAFAWVRETLPGVAGVDPTQVAAVGHSAGGYLTLWGGAMVRPRLQALVSFYGYGDIIADWYRLPDPHYCQGPAVSEAEARAVVGQTAICTGSPWEPRDRFYRYCRQQGRWPQEVVGFDPETDPEAFTPYCPLRNVDAEYPPTLLLHGDQDTDVPYEQSALMAAALARAGVAHEFITIFNGPHGFDEAETEEVEKVLGRVEGFLRERVG